MESSNLHRLFVFFALSWLLLTALPFCTLANESGPDTGYPCREATAKITIDGDLREWQSQRPLPVMLVRSENISTPTWKGPKDLSLICWLLWDDDYLYMASEVHDDDHKPYAPGPWMFIGDGFQLAFDTLDDSLVIPAYDSNDIEIGISSIQEGGNGYCWSSGISPLNGIIPVDKLKVAYKPFKQGGSGYYEIAIPWKSLTPFKPAIGAHMAFNILYNDNDGTQGRRGWAMLTPGIAEKKLPFMFEKITLVGPSEGRVDPQIATDKRYYNAGQNANLCCYLNWDKSTSSPAEASVAIKNKDRIVHTQSKHIKLNSGINRIDFTYKVAGTHPYPLDCTVAVTPAGSKESIVAHEPIYALTTNTLKARVDEIASLNTSLRALIDQADKAGIDTSYPRVTAAMVDVYLKYRKSDLEKADPNLPLVSLPCQFDYMADSTRKAMAEVRDLMAHPDHVKALPKIDMTDIVIKNGTFYKGGQPVMLLGPLGWWRFFDDLDQIAGMGFNYISSGPIPSDVLVDFGKSKTDITNYLSQQLDRARQLNLAVDMLISPHPIPDFVNTAYPDERDYPMYSQYPQGHKRLLEDYWNIVIPAFADKPALASWDMVNEWSFQDGRLGVKTHPIMPVRFRNYLRERYTDIDTLNNKWKTSYRQFDEIDPTKIDQAKSIGAYYDWTIFKQSEAAKDVSRMHDLIRRYDPKTPVSIKIIATMDLQPETFGPSGADREMIDDILEIHGCDCGGPMHFDLYKSLQPDKPCIDSEEHYSVNNTAPEVRTDIWQAFLHGQSAHLMFAWENSYDPEILAAGALLHIPRAMEMAGRTNLDLRRLGPEIVKFQQAIPKAQVAILYSNASMILDKDYPPALRAAYMGLSQLDTQIRFISERQISEGKLVSDGIKVLVVPGAKYVNDAAIEKICDYLKSGGMVYAQIGSLEYDPYGALHQLGSLSGIHWIDKQLSAVELRSMFDGVLDQCSTTRIFRLTASDGSPLSNVEFRMVPDGNSLLAYAINLSSEDIKVRLKSNQKITKIRELINGADLDDEFTISAQDIVILRIT